MTVARIPPDIGAHGLLTGLGDDDHVRYLDKDGTRALTGDWAAGAARKITVGSLDIPLGQIVFPASQNASADVNTLDDYEEGTWTPDLQFGEAKAGITYGTQAGYYTKIGNIVTVSGKIVLTSKGTSTGRARIYGLPFTLVNDLGGESTVALYLNRVTFANAPEASLFLNTNYAGLYEITEAGTVAELFNTDFANDSLVRVHVVYQVE